MRVLVTTASKHGSTRQIGEVIADQLQQHGHQLLCRDVEEVGDADIVQAGAIVLGTAVYGARLLSAGSAFASRLAHEFGGLVWLFGVGLKNVTVDPLRVTTTQPAEMGYRAGRYPVFGGVVETATLSAAERALIGAVGAHGKDLRDLELVQAWAALVAVQVSAAERAQGSRSTLPVV
ncbi:flavodoxin domain-containing protein [Pseudactinotalea sp.]|uniref:flavodoxin domain-containing protein n=1 Tax=Pseudactinotalea sp. TaxID=1926260 RepID=UPI003B3A4ACC